MQNNEQRRVIWRHPQGIYETVEVSGAGGPRIPLTDKEEKEICEMYETMPLAIVAASMHRSSKTVRAVLEKHGITLRKYGPRTKKNH